MEATAHRLFRPAAVAAWALLMAAVLSGPSLLSLRDPGDFLIRGTIRVSLLYLFFAAMLLLERRAEARVFWTLAWAAYIVHVVMAFEHYHHWRHASAFHHVEDVSGFGPGIFVSYLFTLLWTIDVVWWNLAPHSHANRPRWLNLGWLAFLAFVVFNGTIVYESGTIRTLGLLGFGMMLVCWAGRQFRSNART